MNQGWTGLQPTKYIDLKPSKKNCDYSDIVPTSFYTHPPEGDRDSNYRDKINVISTPPLPPVVGTLKLKNISLKYAKFYKLPAWQNYFTQSTAMLDFDIPKFALYAINSLRLITRQVLKRF